MSFQGAIDPLMFNAVLHRVHAPVYSARVGETAFGRIDLFDQNSRAFDATHRFLLAIRFPAKANSQLPLYPDSN